jgi:CMP-N-acetylneuraminic acid synthetase
LVEAEKRTHIQFDYLMLLQPTNPGRTMEEVERAVALVEKDRPDFLYTYYHDENLDQKYIAGCKGEGIVVIRSGCVYMYSRDFILSGFPSTSSFIPMKVSKTRGYNINVAQDFAIQEALWKSG